MKVLERLKELEELIVSGNSLPFSSKALVNPVEMTEIIEEIREELPRELQEAKKIVEERNRILVEAQNDAERIKNEAEKRLEELINTNEITRNATAQAETILEKANTTAKQIRVGTKKYSEKMLYSVQVQLKELNDQIEKNREELNNIK